MKNLFSPEGKLWRILNTVTDIFGLSVIWLVLMGIVAGFLITEIYERRAEK